MPSLEANSFLLEEEETYEPPTDPDSGGCTDLFSSSYLIGVVTIGLSLEELGMRALFRLPRDRAIDGLLAFNTMRWVSISGTKSTYLTCVCAETTS